MMMKMYNCKTCEGWCIFERAIICDKPLDWWLRGEWRKV